MRENRGLGYRLRIYKIAMRNQSGISCLSSADFTHRSEFERASTYQSNLISAWLAGQIHSTGMVRGRKGRMTDVAHRHGSKTRPMRLVSSSSNQ